MKQTWLYRWDVKSRTTSETYIVSMKANGTWGCSCKKWIFAKAPKPDCHHIAKVKVTEPLAKVLMDAKAQPFIQKQAARMNAHAQAQHSDMQKIVAQEPYFVTQTTRSIILED